MTKFVFFLFLLAVQCGVAQSVSSTGKTSVMVCDGRPSIDDTSLPDPPRLAVYFNELRAIEDSRPGENTSWGQISAGKYVVTAKDSKDGTVLLPETEVILEAGTYFSLVIKQDGEKLEAIAISVKPKETKALMKAEGTAVFIPINLSSDSNYTLKYANLERQSTSDTFDPGGWKELPVHNEGKWSFSIRTGQAQSQEIPAGKFPPVKLLTGHAALILLPDPKSSDTQIRVLDAMGGGIIAEDS